MVFSSIPFLFYFLPLCLLVYFLLPKNARNTVLFVFSLIFYAWGEPVYVVLMLFSTVLDYCCGRMIHKHRGTKKAKAALLVSVIVNLSLLAVFKYSDFLIESVNGLLGTGIPLPHLPLPIGISFYTFQTMSYSIDLYRGETDVQKNILSFGAYVALFPQLIAGPIVRYKTVARELDSRRENLDDFGSGIHRFIIGLGKKVLLGNSIGMVWDTLSAAAPGEQTVLGAWLGILCYAFQIYFDFSGYSDMAIGLGRMFGFHFDENFDYPYCSQSITEFWRRWHISLGTWFREYVYIPLGGNRKGVPRQILNIAVVWLLTGIWHGASWNFLLWGVYYAVLLIAEKLFLLKLLQRLPRLLRHLYALLMILIGWVIFAFDQIGAGLAYLGRMFGMGGIPMVDNRSLFLLLTNTILLIVLILASTPLPKRLMEKAGQALSARPALRGIAVSLFTAAVFLLVTAYLVDGSYNPFLYFRF